MPWRKFVLTRAFWKGETPFFVGCAAAFAFWIAALVAFPMGADRAFQFFGMLAATSFVLGWALMGVAD